MKVWVVAKVPKEVERRTSVNQVQAVEAYCVDEAEEVM